MSAPLLLTNDERSLSESEVQRHFDNIDTTAKLISDNPENIIHRMSRAIDFCLVQDFSAALNDLNEALALEGELWPVYFMRAAVRCKLFETERINENITGGVNIPAVGNKKEATNIEYHLIVSDLTQVITLMPDFAHAYYNRANIYVKMGDYKSAMVDYSEAININPEFAEAYFNRGLTLVFQGKTMEGIADLSKAGELGLYSAYNIIKRFKDK